ncbi:MAG TPA: ABC transporter ATP-binding protein [Steroidobacteraceae bacterium]|nr:ABC transporter ATP-binding protein [Steroidobacteraceae bacterium]
MSTSDSDRSLGARWRWLWPYVRRQLPALSVVLLLTLISSALAIALPYLSKLIIDRGLLARNFPLLVELCLTVVALAALSFLIGGFTRWLYVRASGRMLFALRENVYAHLLSLPPSFFRKRPTGDLVTRLDGDVAEIQRFSTDTLLAFVNGVLLLAGAAIIMVAMSWQLALVAAAVLPLQLAVRRWARPLIAKRTRALREQASSVAQFLFETLSNVKGIQGAVTEDHERQRLTGLNQTYLSRLLSVQIVSYVLGGISGLLSHMATASVFVYGGYRVIEGDVTVGTLVAFLAYLSRGTGSAVSLLNLYTAYQRAVVSLDRVEELLAQPAGTENVPQPRRAGEIEGEGRGGARGGAHRRLPDASGGALSLHGVTLGRATCGAELLSDCSLDIPRGSKVVIHGASGVGKSTLVDALRRFVPVDAGCILLDGADIREYDLPALRRSIEVLSSQPLIFRGTVLENLRYGNFDSPEESVLEAARRAGVTDVVELLPEGFATLVGSGGHGLSTGQCQRIAVARAIVRRPSVIVLDEALTNLDAESSQALQDVIDEQFGHCTRIIVSHAPARVLRPDLILEMREGRLLPSSAHAHA